MVELRKASAGNPNAIVVGATVVCSCWGRRPRCRGVLLHGGRNRIDYLKIGSDNVTAGTNVWPRKPIYEAKDICIGLMICMDVQSEGGLFRARVVEQVQKSACIHKIICVSAAMGSEWFSAMGTELPFPQNYAGIYFALCNSNSYGDARCKSFIADKTGRVVAKQHGREPIRAKLTAEA